MVDTCGSLIGFSLAPGETLHPIAGPDAFFDGLNLPTSIWNRQTKDLPLASGQPTLNDEAPRCLPLGA